MKASGIDWSKAPDGATHFMPENSENWASWYKKHDSKWMCWLFDGDSRWSEVGYDEDYILNNSIAKQEEWNGTGMPPVGTVCEYLDSSGSQWHRVTVMYSGEDLMVLRGATRDGEEVEIPKFKYEGPKFRPIRTHEQIAAEKRKAAVDEMRAMFRFSDAQQEMVRAVCYSLYDAGYRKVEGDKQ